jgi:hypothetical protein
MYYYVGDYQQNQCKPGTDCEPCEQRLPSCIGKLDGNNTITGRELTPDYVVCFMNRTVSVETCPVGYFSSSIGECRTTIGAGMFLLERNIIYYYWNDILYIYLDD